MNYLVEMANLSAIKNQNYSYYNQIAFNIEVDNINKLPELIEVGYNKLVEIEGNNPENDEIDSPNNGLWDFEKYSLISLKVLDFSIGI